MRKFFLLIILVSLSSFVGTSSKKRISDSLYRYEFFTTDVVVTALPEREYFWFKGGAIHNSEYGAGGMLLHDEYLKFYHDNQLAEAGRFTNGLKTGYWKAWYKSGTLQSKIYWSNGQMDGSYHQYDHTGQLVEEGKYRNNKKHGRWINYTRKDTLKYRNGNLVIKKLKPEKKDGGKPGFFKRVFGKKINDTIAKPSVKNVNPSPAPKEKKGNFFNRIFSKKEKSSQKTAKKPVAISQEEKKDGFFTRLFRKNKPKSNDSTGQ